MKVVQEAGGAVEALLAHQLLGQTAAVRTAVPDVPLPGNVSDPHVVAHGALTSVPYGTTRPVTSPRDSHRRPGRDPHHPVMVTSSPSSSHVRVSPAARCSGCRPPAVSSISDPSLPGV